MRARAAGAWVAAAAVLAGCSQPTTNERDRVEARIVELAGVTDVRLNTSIPGFADDGEPQHVVVVTLTVAEPSSAEEVDAAVLGAAEVVWRATDEWLDIDRIRVHARPDTDVPGASSGSMATPTAAVVGLHQAIERSAVPRARGQLRAELTVCEAWATFGDRTAEPYRSTTQWAVSGCDREVTVVLPTGVADHPEAPLSVHLRNVAPVLASIAVLVAPIYGLVAWSRRGRSRRQAVAPPPPTGRPHPMVVDGHRWTSPAPPPPPPPSPTS